MRRVFLLTALISLAPIFTQAQNKTLEFQTSPTTKLKLFAASQIWLRHTDLNPGSTIDGTPKTSVTDMSIRRFRMGLVGYVMDGWFFKVQLGMNNMNPLSTAGTDLRILCLESFYTIDKALVIGGGKTGYVGLSRYAGPASGAALGFDLPFFAMTTVGITDDILRRPAAVVKGDIGKFNYRAVVAKQLSTKRSYTLGEDASFQKVYQEPQYSAYLKYQFFDQEKNTSAFSAGTYYGSKKILNIGAGFEYQKNALQGLVNSDTVGYDMLHFAVDVFADFPLDADNRQSVTFYGGYFNYDFGKNYIRNVGVNNSANGTIDGSFNGSGNAFPATGTGQIFYMQGGFRQAISRNNERLAVMPFASLQIGAFDKLDESMIMYDYGISYLVNGHKNKLTLGIQSRPIFDTNTDGLIQVTERKNMYVLQYQVKI